MNFYRRLNVLGLTLSNQMRLFGKKIQAGHERKSWKEWTALVVTCSAAIGAILSAEYTRQMVDETMNSGRPIFGVKVVSLTATEWTGEIASEYLLSITFENLGRRPASDFGINVFRFERPFPANRHQEIRKRIANDVIPHLEMTHYVPFQMEDGKELGTQVILIALGYVDATSEKRYGQRFFFKRDRSRSESNFATESSLKNISELEYLSWEEYHELKPFINDIEAEFSDD